MVHYPLPKTSFASCAQDLVQNVSMLILLGTSHYHNMQAPHSSVGFLGLRQDPPQVCSPCRSHGSTQALQTPGWLFEWLVMLAMQHQLCQAWSLLGPRSVPAVVRLCSCEASYFPRIGDTLAAYMRPGMSRPPYAISHHGPLTKQLMPAYSTLHQARITTRIKEMNEGGNMPV